MKRICLPVALLISVLLFNCDPPRKPQEPEITLDKALKLYKDTIEKTLAKYERLQKVVDTIPTLDSATGKLTGLDTRLDFYSGHYGSYNMNVNALIMHEEDLQDITREKGTPPLRIQHNNTVNYAGYIMQDTRRWKEEPKVCAGYIEGFGKRLPLYKYILVVRTLNYRAPELLTNNSFNVGIYKGQGMLFRLADAAYLGGFPFEAVSSMEVEGSPDDMEKWLHNDMWENATNMLHSNIRKHCVSVKLEEHEP